MSTHALTIILIDEWDGQERQVAALWRKFDGYPDTHLSRLKAEVIRTDCFVTVAELTRAVFLGLMGENPAPWQFRMVCGDEPDLWPAYIYRLWLDRPAKPNRPFGPWYAKDRNAVPYLGVHTPDHLGSFRPGKCFYSGPVAQVNPEALYKEVLAYQDLEYFRRHGAPGSTAPRMRNKVHPPEDVSQAGGTAV